VTILAQLHRCPIEHRSCRPGVKQEIATSSGGAQAPCLIAGPPNIGATNPRIWVLAGSAAYGTARPDVATLFPNAPGSIGFSFALDSTRYASGPHRVTVRAIDAVGNVAILREASVQVANTLTATPLKRRTRR
jgi:hypothetical protein